MTTRTEVSSRLRHRRRFSTLCALELPSSLGGNLKKSGRSELMNTARERESAGIETSRNLATLWGLAAIRRTNAISQAQRQWVDPRISTSRNAIPIHSDRRRAREVAAQHRSGIFAQILDHIPDPRARSIDTPGSELIAKPHAGSLRRMPAMRRCKVTLKSIFAEACRTTKNCRAAIAVLSWPNWRAC